MKVRRIILRRGRERRVVVVESSLTVELPQVGDTVSLQGEPGWRVCRMELLNVLARFPKDPSNHKLKPAYERRPYHGSAAEGNC